MSRFSKQSFFFQQKKSTYGENKRVKKAIDTQSVLGERRESILVFRPGAGGEEELGNIRLQAHRQRRPSSAASRRSSVWFPEIDQTGPHLTTNKSLLEADQILEEEPEVPEKEPKYKFNEVKFASTSILSKLSRRFETIGSIVSEVELPESLVDSLILPFYQLVADTIVERREWQTDCYTNLRNTRNKLYLSDTPKPEDPVRQKVETGFNKFIENQRKKAKMSEAKEKVERPLTAKSTASAVSIKSEVSNISDADSRVDYDKLPPELRMQGPEILRHRRESKTPSKPKIPGPRTRLERFNDLKMKAEQEKKLKAKRAAAGLSLFSKKPSEHKKDSISDEGPQEVHRSAAMEMINFSMSSKTCADHGWIVHPSVVSDPEAYTLHQWTNTRLQEAMRQREESYLTAKLRGEDGPLVVKYYSDPHYRPFKGARHRTASFPLPAVLSKLPPSLGTFASHNTLSDMFLSPTEGQVMCMLLLPDGSGFCNYYSGRRAVSLSRRGDGTRGLYVVVFDDTSANNMIGCFMPDGRVSCYHRNGGGINLITDSEGGLIMDEDGFTTRKWVWPKDGEKMPYSVSIQLNTHVLFQCSGQYQMTLRFSCHGQMQKFPVGLKPEYVDLDHKNDAFWIKRTNIVSNGLQSNLPFESDTAKKIFQQQSLIAQDEATVTTGTAGATGRKPPQSSNTSTSKPQSSEVLVRSQSGLLQTDSLTKCDGESSIRKELKQYQIKVKSIVEDWLNHYRQTIGITPPSRSSLLQESFPSSSHRLSLSRGGGGGAITGGHPSSRSMSRSSISRLQQQQLLQYPSLVKMSSNADSRPISPEQILMVEGIAGMPPDDQAQPPGLPRTVSPMEQFIRRPQSLERKPFKVGPALPRKSQPIKIRPGCPNALHTMILRKLDEMPQCRCDKRKIPLIRDLEFDVYLSSHVPSNQLIIINITSNDITKRSNEDQLPLLVSIHEKQNTNRYAPCQQSGRDAFRLLKYNLSSASDDLNTSVPLLVARHNVTAGMFMGKLIGIYTGFNGYGTTKKDFLKQVQRSIDNGTRGLFLPNDFKFSSSAVKQHSSSLWAFPVSGVQDELISLTPSSISSPSPSINTRLR